MACRRSRNSDTASELIGDSSSFGAKLAGAATAGGATAFGDVFEQVRDEGSRLERSRAELSGLFWSDPNPKFGQTQYSNFGSTRIFRYPVMPEFTVEEQGCSLFSGNLGGDCGKMNHLAETIDEDQDTRAPLVVRRGAKNEVDANGSPRLCGDGQWTQWSLSRTRRFDTLTHFTRAYPRTKPFVHLRPVEVTRQSSERLFTTKMTANGGIVVFVQDAGTKVVGSGDDDPRSVELVDGVHQQIAVKLVPLKMTSSRTRKRCQRLVAGRTEVVDDGGVKVVVGIGRHNFLTEDNPGVAMVELIPSATQTAQSSSSSSSGAV
ncbi:unnamed protein product [Phytophthora lilii]|uniref:Unnamed protein product n=1 Tax=Phytophthora lilii TaxID=2077276 RepID=A0A9W6UBJ3_9STRA|nr:unnamed protein product [Phytophthora lilii]